MILEDFFEFEVNNPINRIAYTKQDIEYKLKIIKKMQELGMSISIDEIGNICGEIKVNEGDSTFLAIGSHTDSVPDGGQYDGVVGVITGLATVEGLLNKGQLKDNLKVIIYACEESSRFDVACVGSKYLSGNLKNNILTKQDKDGITLQDAVKEFIETIKEHSQGIEEVDKVLQKGKCKNAIETHIEQYQVLSDFKKQIGIVEAIVNSLRFKLKGQSDDNGKNVAEAMDMFSCAVNEWSRTLHPNNFRVTHPKSETTLEVKENSTVRQNDAMGNKPNGENEISWSMNKIPGEAERIVKVEISKNTSLEIITEYIDGILSYIGETAGVYCSYNLLETNFVDMDSDSLSPKDSMVLQINMEGKAEHSGSTPMEDRKDADFANSLLGHFFKMNNSSEKNMVEFTTLMSRSGMEVRPMSLETTWKKTEVGEMTKMTDIRINYPVTPEGMLKSINNLISVIEEKTGVKLSYEIITSDTPVKMNNQFNNLLWGNAKKMGLSIERMSSWAGHDMAYTSKMVDNSTLVFIPSTGGSHNPGENTTKQDIENAIELNTALAIDLMQQRSRKEPVLEDR